jgi:DNA polymerase III epsilon subunit-like protein
MDGHLLRFDKQKKLTFIDCETYNLCLSFVKNRPWQIALIDVIGNEIIKETDLLINWPKEKNLGISVKAAQMTRHDPSKVESLGISPEEAFDILDEKLKTADYILGHNILGFDVYLIREYYRLMGFKTDFFLKKIIDTKCLAQGIKLSTPFNGTENLLNYQYRMYNCPVKGVKTNLALLGKEYEIEHDYKNLHDALTDLQLNVKIWNKIKWQVSI